MYLQHTLPNSLWSSESLIAWNVLLYAYFLEWYDELQEHVESCLVATQHKKRKSEENLANKSMIFLMFNVSIRMAFTLRWAVFKHELTVYSKLAQVYEQISLYPTDTKLACWVWPLLILLHLAVTSSVKIFSLNVWNTPIKNIHLIWQIQHYTPLFQVIHSPTPEFSGSVS